VLKTPVLAGAQQPPPEEAVGMSRSPGEILKAGPGNIKTFKRTFKELYDFSMVRPEYCSACTY
jgi:hypothetical protein